jgi:hypothetical protein
MIGTALWGAAACASSGKTATTSAGEVAPTLANQDLSSAKLLIGELTNAVPQLNQTQAVLAAGSLLGLAQARMADTQFTTIANGLPGARALVAAAQQSGLPSQSDVTSGASGTSVLSKAGIPTNVGEQIIPALGSAISSRVSPQVANEFLSAVGR